MCKIEKNRRIYSDFLAPYLGVSKAVLCCLAVFVGVLAEAAPKEVSYHSSVPVPTLSEVRYGDHERNVLDFWKAESDKPTPLVFVIHGGAWKQGSKEQVSKFVNTSSLLEAGISVVSINYRLMEHSQQVQPPVKAPMYDAARALQFVRSQAEEWNIDKERISASGASAGSCTSLWLAYHDDLADPVNEDPIARESTRLWSVSLKSPQTTLDPKLMREWTPNIKYGGHAFGKENFEAFLADRESIMPWIKEYSPYSLLTADDPPSFLVYKCAPTEGMDQQDATHSANFGSMLQKRCVELGIVCTFVYPGATGYRSMTHYLIESLKTSAPEKMK